MNGDPSNRRSERIEILGEMRGEVMVYEPMAITQISVAGVQVETAFPLQIDSLHDFRLVLGDQSIVVKGRIVHSHVCDLEEQRTFYRAGVEFVTPSQHVVEAIGDFMRAVVAGREANS
jgi:hypothetical protein